MAEGGQAVSWEGDALSFDLSVGIMGEFGTKQFNNQTITICQYLCLYFLL